MIAVVLVFLRFYARIKRFKHLCWDDFFAFIAVILSIVNAIIWQTLVVHDMYEVINVLRGVQMAGPHFFAHLRRFFHSQLVLYIFFNSTLWAIKFSFLIFFKRLGKNVRRQRMLFWPVFAFTVVSYLITVALAANFCLGNSLPYVLRRCGTRSAFKNNRLTLICGFALDVSTDFTSKQSFSLFFHISLCRIQSDICV